MSSLKLTRRDFLKVAGITAVTTAIMLGIL